MEACSTASEDPNDSEREDAGSEAASDDLSPAELEPDPPLMRPSAAAMRAGLPQLDMVDLSQVSARRAAVMKGVPRLLWGSFRIALKLALEVIAAGSVANDRLRQERGGNCSSSFHGCFSIAHPGVVFWGKTSCCIVSRSSRRGNGQTSSEPARIAQSKLLLLPGDVVDARSLDWTSGCRELNSPVGDRLWRV